MSDSVQCATSAADTKTTVCQGAINGTSVTIATRQPESARNLGLKPLQSAALAAYRVSNWITQEGGFAQRPLGTARTLLAPSATEIARVPELGQLAANLQHYGDQVTETPLPLRDAAGAIVYPGFPADVLFAFRQSSVAAQLILWATIGLGIFNEIYWPAVDQPQVKDFGFLIGGAGWWRGP